MSNCAKNLCSSNHLLVNFLFLIAILNNVFEEIKFYFSTILNRVYFQFHTIQNILPIWHLFTQK